MWLTSSGDRRLREWEEKLFLAGVVSLSEALMEAPSEDWAPDTGVPPFDNIELPRRLGVLLYVARDVISDRPSPEMRAWNEGAVMAVFDYISLMVEIEIGMAKEDTPPPAYWRKLIVNVVSERQGELHVSEPRLASTDLLDWSVELDCIIDDVLLDADCMGSPVQDMPADYAAIIRAQLDIPEDYFVDEPPLLNHKEHAELLRLLEQWTEQGNQVFDALGESLFSDCS